MSSTYDVVNPATEAIVTTVDLADLEATDAAIDRAKQAFQTWRLVAPADRATPTTQEPK